MHSSQQTYPYVADFETQGKKGNPTPTMQETHQNPQQDSEGQGENKAKARENTTHRKNTPHAPTTRKPPLCNQICKKKSKATQHQPCKKHTKTSQKACKGQGGNHQHATATRNPSLGNQN